MNYYIGILAVTLSLAVSANTASAQQDADKKKPELVEIKSLGKTTTGYVRCTKVMLGNFASDEDARNAERAVFIPAIISNVKKITNILIKLNDPKAHDLVDLVEWVGEEGFVGFTLAQVMSEDFDREFSVEKLELWKKYNHDQNQVNRFLWGKYGCSEIYSSLKIQ